ncbi:MAG TPA: bifunctional DNA primase/polymerase, partial [Planctomycetota bacterium]|nr:bifunctional DNA primase/polymerase [Planctomycetota bacterium]
MSGPNRFLSAAIHYAELGYPVFPCVPGTKRPLTEHGFKDATTDPAQIDAWWTEHPDANVGIATAGLAVIDIDGAENTWLAGDHERSESLACGPMSLTPRGGRHHVFRQPAGKAWASSSGKLAPKVDVRANGGYIIAPPSVTEDGAYCWAETFELDVPPDKLPEPPAWLVALLDAQDRPQPAPATAGNAIPSGQRNVAVARLAGAMRRVGMTEAELLAALERVNADRCQPPLTSSEIRRIASSVARYPPDQISVAMAEDHFGQDFSRSPAASYLAVAQLLKEYTSMCKPIIHGLLREGEIMNVIAAPKTGKSWIVLDLALSIVNGRPWLEFPTTKGRVLLLDNELHPQTLANRIPRVADALQLAPGGWDLDFCVKTLRGQLQDLFKMEEYFKALPTGHFKLIILDAFYRFMPRDMDENDNGTMANLYNLL